MVCLYIPVSLQKYKSIDGVVAMALLLHFYWAVVKMTIKYEDKGSEESIIIILNYQSLINTGVELD